MPTPIPSRRPPLLSLLSLNTQRHSPELSSPESQYASFPSPESPTPPTPAFLSPPSLRHTPRTSYSPPFTPPGLIPSTFYDLDNPPFPFTPTTPIFSPIPEHDSEENIFAASFARSSRPSHSTLRSELDPYALPFVPSKAHFAVPPKFMHPHSAPRPTPPLLALSPFKRRPRLSRGAKSDRILTITTANAADARFYSPHFPPGHVLDHKFVRAYAPGAEIGVGGFGFVVTARNRLQGQEVAVKFIEIGKVHPWGWSEDSVLGRVPTEALMLKMMDHPGIIKFLDLFQDKAYFYLVQELHGSPWRRRVPAPSEGPRLKVLSAPSTFKEGPPFIYPAAHELAQLPQIYDPPRHPEPVLCDDSYHDSGLAFPPGLPSSSSLSSLSPVSPVSPCTPSLGLRPNMSRRLSHDLFECIEEHQRLSESQARYIFAQVVDAVYYLHSIGVAHRDIKDENVLIDRAFRVKIIDFGSASCVDPRDPGLRPWYRHFRGTVAYAPAEILRHVKCHQAEPADVWALGVLLAYLVTGRSAFPTAADAAQGRILLHKCRVRADGEARPLAQKENSVSAQYGDLLRRCLDPDPSTRASIAEIKVHSWLKGALDKA